MSRRDWLRIVAALTLSTVAVAGLIFWSIVNYQQEQAEQRQEAPRYEGSEKIKSYDPCLRMQGIVDRINCVLREATAQREDKRAQSDLNAQQDMAAWAYALLLVTATGTAIAAIGVVATVIGIWLIWLNLGEARKVTAQAIEATNAAVRSADAAQDSLTEARNATAATVQAAQESKRQADIAESAFNMLERPDIFVKVHGKLDRDTKPIWELTGTATAVNVGRTPAQVRHFTIQTNFGAVEPDVHIPHEHADIAVLSTQKETAKTGFAGWSVTHDEFKDFTKGEKPVLIYGEVIYDDFSGRRWKQRFARSVTWQDLVVEWGGAAFNYDKQIERA